MRTLLCLFALAATIGPSSAEWSINSVRNPMTDREDKIAAVLAKSRADGIEAFLQVECVPSIGGRVVSVVISRQMTQGRIGLNFRIDSGAVEQRVLPVGSSLRNIALHGLDERQFAAAKRFRLQLFPAGGPELFYDFDISGADKAMATLACKPRR